MPSVTTKLSKRFAGANPKLDADFKPKGDETFGLQRYVTVTRLSTGITREYPIGYETDWVQHFRHDLEAGVFTKPG